jgi:hypothetical protein
VFDQTGTVIPLADFLYADVYTRLMGRVQRGVYLGLHEAAGVLCHHLSFEQATIDWQIWIDAGRDPLPRKLVIAYKTEDEVPQCAVTIRTWTFGRLARRLLVQPPPARGASRYPRWQGAARPEGRAGEAMKRAMATALTLRGLVIPRASPQAQRSKGS